MIWNSEENAATYNTVAFTSSIPLPSGKVQPQEARKMHEPSAPTKNPGLQKQPSTGSDIPQLPPPDGFKHVCGQVVWTPYTWFAPQGRA